MPCVVGGGFFSRPKPSSTCSGDSTSTAGALPASRGFGGERLLRAAAELAETGDAPEHFHEQTRQRQVRPVGIGGDVEEDHLAIAALGGRDQRRAVLQARPHLHVGAERAGIGQHLLGDQHFGRHGQSGKQPFVAERRQRLRRRPRQRAAERASADAAGPRAAGRRRPSRAAARQSAPARRPSSPIRQSARARRAAARRCRPASSPIRCAS